MNATSDLPPDLHTSLPTGHPRSLIHLLSCARCRDAALGGLLDIEASFAPRVHRGGDSRRNTLGAGAMVLALGQAWASLVEPESEEERLQVDRIVATLESLPPEDLGPTWTGKRYATPVVLAALLGRGEEALRSEPISAERLGLLALFLAGQLVEKDPSWVPPGTIRAGLLVGAARRRQGKLKSASQALHQIGPFLTGPLEEASYAREVGLVRWQQGLSRDADALLTQAAEAFAEAKEAGYEAACWALLGLLRCEELEMEKASRAQTPLLRSLPGLNPEVFPWLALRVRLALAQIEGRRGNFGGAEEQANLARSLGSNIGPEEGGMDPALSIAWTKARLRDLESRPREAEQLLVPVRTALVAESRLGEASLASLDLALIAVHRAQLDRAASLVDELAFRFRGEPGLVFAVQALADFEESFLENPREARASHALACRFLRQSFRSKGLPIELPPYP